MHDSILSQGHGKFLAQDLRLGVLDCKVYHNVSMNTRCQVDFDRLRQRHMLDDTEEDKDMSWNIVRWLIIVKKKKMIRA
jgi:hypothetical protein